jgi:hypothetical protein
MTTSAPQRICLPAEDEDDVERWVNLRGARDRFKAGERRKLFEVADAVDQKSAGGSLELMRHMLAHLITGWWMDAPHPRVVWKDGQVTGYEHLESLDALDTDVEDLLLGAAKWWMDRMTINFKPTPDPNSPTKPSDG